MGELHWLDATATADLIRTRRKTSTEVLEHYLDRVDRINPKLNAVVSLDRDTALSRARAADAALNRGECWGPLHGVPLTVKDTFEVVGMLCTAGSVTLKDHRPERTAMAVQHLLDAGAILFGKTNTPPFAGDLQTTNDLYGTTGNAWNPNRSAGGSSGGTAVALAAGLTALDLGSDLGGSSRMPAHLNGVFGMRPTWGLISSIGHIPGPPGSLVPDEFNCVGPMAKSARDLRLVFDLIRSADPIFGKTYRHQLPDEELPAFPLLNLACWLHDEAGPVEASVRKVLQGAVETLRSSGIGAVTDARPNIDAKGSFLLFARMIGAITAARKSDRDQEELHRRARAIGAAEPDAYTSFLSGSLMSYADFQKCNQQRALVRAAWASFFSEHDALLSPVFGLAAFEHGSNFFERSVNVDGLPLQGREHLFWASHQVLGNLPSVVVPAGFTDEGLPVGLQITTGHGEDYKAIRLAQLLAQILGASERHPAL